MVGGVGELYDSWVLNCGVLLLLLFFSKEKLKFKNIFRSMKYLKNISVLLTLQIP